MSPLELLPNQHEFFSVPDDIVEALYGGAVGGGKSHALLLFPIYRRFIENPQFKGLILRRTVPQLDNELIPRSKQIYPAFGATWSSQNNKNEWVFPSGAIVKFGHVKDMNAAYNYDGAEYQLMCFDELEQFPKKVYQYLTSRVRAPRGSGLPAIVRSSAMPGGIGHIWVKEHFIDPAPGGRTVIVDEYGNKRMYIPSLLEHNRFVDEKYAQRLYILPEAERKAKLLGDWGAISGLVFTDFRPKRLPGEPENALHVVPAFRIPQSWTRIAAIDWGSSAHTWMGWYAISPDNRGHLYREWHDVARHVSTWGSEFGRLSHGERIEQVWLDRNAWNSDGHEVSVAQLFRHYSGHLPSKAQKDRVLGKLAVQETMRWKQKPKKKVITGKFNPQVAENLHRMRGQAAADAYFARFQPEPDEDNLPKIRIFDQSPEGTPIREVVDCLKTRIYDDRNPEDVKAHEGDDAYDGHRYGCMAVLAYIQGRSPREASLKEALLRRPEGASSGEMTEWYRKLAKLDASDARRNPYRPIRYRRRGTHRPERIPSPRPWPGAHPPGSHPLWRARYF